MSATVLVPKFTDAALYSIRRMLTRHYGRDVEIQVAFCEIHVAESDKRPTRCPAVFWQEHDANFLIIKTGDSAFRGQYFHTPKRQHIAGRDSYPNLQGCVAALLDAHPGARDV